MCGHESGFIVSESRDYLLPLTRKFKDYKHPRPSIGTRVGQLVELGLVESLEGAQIGDN